MSPAADEKLGYQVVWSDRLRDSRKALNSFVK